MADDERLSDPFSFATAALAGPAGMNEQLSYMIWGAVATTTRAFLKTEIRVEANIQRIFVSVTLRPWSRTKRLGKLHAIWLKRAEARAAEYLPKGWRLLVYYEPTKAPGKS